MTYQSPRQLRVRPRVRPRPFPMAELSSPTKRVQRRLRDEWAETLRPWRAAFASARVRASWPDVKPFTPRLWRFFWQRPGFCWWPVHYVRWVRRPEPAEIYRRWPELAPHRPMPSRALEWMPGFAFMPTLLYSEHVETTLGETTTTADPGAAGTSLAVTTRTPFPGAGKFYLVVQASETDKTNREIMRVTGGWGTGAGSFTVTRGLEGTTGVTHVIGSYVALVIVASSLKGSFQRLYVPDVTYFGTASAANGGADASAEISAKQTVANADGGGTVYLPPGFCRWAGTASMVPLSNVQIKGDGQGISTIVVSDNDASTPISGGGSTATNTTLTGAVAIADRIINFTSAASFSVGDWVSLEDSAAGGHAWLTRIAYINANAVTMEEKSTGVFPTATTTIYRATTLLQNFQMRDLTWTSPTGNAIDLTTRLNGTISMTWMLNCTFDNVQFLGLCGVTPGTNKAVLNFTVARHMTLRGLRFERCHDVSPEGGGNLVVNIGYSTQVITRDCHYNRCGGSGCMVFSHCGHCSANNNMIGGNTDWSGYNKWVVGTTGTPTGGTFTINVTPGGGTLATTGTIAWNASAATIQTAINAVITGSATVKCTGGPLPTGVNVYFAGTADGKTNNTLALGTNSLTGGASPAPTFTQTNLSPGLSTDQGGRGIKWIDGANYFQCNNNYFHDTAFDAIRVEPTSGSGTSCFYGQIVGNQLFDDHDIPIYVNFSQDVLIEGNVIDHPSTGGGTFHALYCNNVIRPQIIGNHVSNADSIRLLTVTDGQVIANKTVTTVNQGILLTTSTTGVLVTSNIIRGSTTNSIDSAGSAGGNFVYANTVDRATNLHANDWNTATGFNRIVASDVTVGTSAGTITGLTFFAAANEKWTFDCVLRITTTGTTGTQYDITFPTGGALMAEVFGATTAVTAYTQSVLTTSGGVSASIVTFAGDVFVRISGSYVNGATAGTVAFQGQRGTGSNTVLAKANSNLVAQLVG